MGTTQRQNTDAVCSGRLTRSSDEAPVMGVERRGQVVPLHFIEQLTKCEDEFME
jgi:hypothetical protein